MCHPKDTGKVWGLDSHELGLWPEFSRLQQLAFVSVYNAVLEYTWDCFQASQQFMKSEVGDSTQQIHIKCAECQLIGIMIS